MTIKICFLKKTSVLILMLMLFNIGSGYSQSQYKVYAGLMYHFVKYTQWPAAKPEIILGVMGKTSLNTEIMVINGKVAGTSKIIIKEISDVAEVANCQMVFIPSNLSGKFAEIAAIAKQHNTLIISDSPGASKGGIIINFFEEDSKVKFEISNKNAQACGLKISSDLQKLAKVID
jgi:hypothetical protein